MSDDAPHDQSPTFTRSGVIAIALILLVGIAIAAPLIQQSREAARRDQSRYHLKEIGLALHNYHDTFITFPPGGVFNAESVAFHEWTSFIEPFAVPSVWYATVDFHRPWDDPEQLDLFVNFPSQWPRWRMWTNPSIGEQRSSDGVILNPYAANQNILYRNSSVGLKQIPSASTTLIVADANGNYIPLGYPYGWRDVRSNLKFSPDGFGCPVREITQCLMVDGSVRSIAGQVDAKVLAEMSGADNLRPTDVQVAKPAAPFVIGNREIWRVYRIQPEAERDLLILKVSPDGHVINARFHRDLNSRPEERRIKLDGWFDGGMVKYVQLSGNPNASDLQWFFRLRNLKRLTCSKAQIEGDAVSALANAPRHVEVER